LLFLALTAAAMVAQPWGDDGALDPPGGTRASSSPDAAEAAEAGAKASELPPLPPGVAELKFSDFFEPIGRRGLELAQGLRALDSKRVRILGYMVRQCEAPPGLFLLAPLPVTLHTHEYGLADDLPPTALHVQMSAGDAGRPVPYTPGLLLLTGTLSVGSHDEADGRTSCVRLKLDPPPAAGAKWNPVVLPPAAPGGMGCCANEDKSKDQVRRKGE
jgi:hypothetical protein